ncbi:DUF4097 family beta strand repeat-containing protein [Companilactobacillus nantensis]|uniref:DUF4097 domain-containing protein n=1 Tax=Companilactobacillus nantensis DSM 16982 TaxID=1423774 RepID=A0A0R1WK07_9LACO|nr:DUF4097 family beta strand repeat-containing protein [Companilactobacillus nantensis]KRM18242.1 hypothetical protein FD31_GL001572 [Companilactobacillus nantensis DSM 16982]GEO62904.1 hypothetical protein LNA01_00870 [Companilactobacillus nantensis]
MSEMINKLVDEKLTKIFADYPTTDDLKELQEELSSDLIASAEDKITAETTEQAAVDQAFQEFGDIDEVISQVLDEHDDNETENHYHKTIHEHHIDLDDDGIRIDNGKILNIDEDGLTINNGKTVRIDGDGVKLGNMVINENGINFHGQSQPKTSFDEFNAKFNNNAYDTEVHVESLPLTDESEFAVEDINKVDVTYENADVKILPTKGTKIMIHEYMSRTNPDYQVKTDLVDDTLVIKQGRWPHFLPLKVKVQILLPESFAGKVRVNNRSGNLLMQNLSQLDSALINVKSGIVNIRNLKLDQLLINASSGKVVMEDLNISNDLSVESRSGVIKLDNVYSPNYNILARSGTIKGIDLGGGGKITAKSGTIKLEFAKITSNVAVTNNSGTVRLTMPEHDSYNFDLEAKSGTVKMNHAANYKHDVQSLKEGTVGTDPLYNLSVRAISGTIKVN